MRSLSEVHPEKDAHAHTDCGPDAYRDADCGPHAYREADCGTDSYPDRDCDRDTNRDRDCHRDRDEDPYRDPHGVAERQCFSGSDGGIDGGGDQREPSRRN